jgi:hypothetical protein
MDCDDEAYCMSTFPSGSNTGAVEIAGLGAGWTLGAWALAATWEKYEFDAPNPEI